MKSLALFVVCLAFAASSPVGKDDSVLRMAIGNFVNCMNSDLSLCLKENALKATDRLRSVRQLNIYDGITLINNGPREAKSLETLSADLDVRKKQVSERLWESATELMQNSDLEISFADPNAEDESRALDDTDESRAKKDKKKMKKLKMLMPLIMLLKAKVMAMTVLFLGIIAIAIVKLAFIAKIAFLAKIFGMLKGLLSKKGGHGDSGDWQPAHIEPAHGHSGGGGGGGAGGWEQGWSRSKNDGASLAYSAYRK